MLEKLAPVDEQEEADDEKAGDERDDAFPVRLAVEQVDEIGAGVFAGENEDAVRNQTAEKEWDKDVERAPNAGHRHGGEEGGR